MVDYDYDLVVFKLFWLHKNSYFSSSKTSQKLIVSSRIIYGQKQEFVSNTDCHSIRLGSYSNSGNTTRTHRIFQNGC